MRPLQALNASRPVGPVGSTPGRHANAREAWFGGGQRAGANRGVMHGNARPEGRQRIAVAAVTLFLAAACAADSGGAARDPNAGPATGTVAGASGSDPAMSGAGAGAGAGTSTGSGAGAGTGGAGSTDDPNVSTQDAPCATAGTTRQCCGTGVQTCMGVEFPTWGLCVDGLAQEVVCNSCATNEFGPGCDAGTPPPEPPPQQDAGPPPEPDAGVPPAECGPGMECKPGSVRYCDVAGLEWSLSTCDSTGHWGTCVATAIPAAANGQGCAQNDYAPEMCCGPAVICCQDNPGGPFLDFGSGACLAVSCP